jgi:hypothetical protein
VFGDGTRAVVSFMCTTTRRYGVARYCYEIVMLRVSHIPRSMQRYISLRSCALIITVLFASALGFIFPPHTADAWMTTTGANWKSTNSYSLNPSGWASVGSLSTAMCCSQLVVIGDYVYLFGANIGFATYNNVVYRAPLSNPTSWSDSGGRLPSNLGLSHVAVIGDYVYLFGGYTGAGFTNAIYRAPVSNPTSWSNTGAGLPGVVGDGQLAVIGGYVYIFGGWNGSAATRNVYRASVSSPTSWSNMGALLPANLYSSHVAVIGDYVYLFGGNSGVNATNVIYRAPVSNPTSWSNTGSVLPSSFGVGQLAVIGDYVYLFGGRTSTGGYSNLIYRAPISNPLSWSNTGAGLPSILGYSQLAIIGGNVYLFGGNNGSAVLSTIYRAPLTPTNPTCSVTADQNPIAYGAQTTLRWTSTNATTMYINNVGYVTPNTSGSATVGPLATTNYNGTATGGSGANCNFTLTVNTPISCTLDGVTVPHGQSHTFYSTQTAPAGQTCSAHALSRTCNNGVLSSPAPQVATFNSSQNWTVPAGVTSVEVLVVAGGGGGGPGDNGNSGGGGGGAGGVSYSASTAVTPGASISVTVGTGGVQLTKGGNSSFGSLLSAEGGGGGANGAAGSLNPGGIGGSGGGGSRSGVGGSGTSGQGNNGGNATAAGGGGGGRGSSGASASGVNGGTGGNGQAYSISGSSITYGGGGGGGRADTTGVCGSGGAGGGGHGGGGPGVCLSAGTGTSGTANTGGGGGGGGGGTGAVTTAGNGGSGVVIVKYQQSAQYQYATCTAPPICALSLNPTSVTQGQSSTLSWTSTGATSCTGTNFSTGGLTSGNVQVTPSQSTTYTASCSNVAGSAQCTGTGVGGQGAALNVTCSQSWSCTGAGNQTITQTNANCSTTNLTTCVSPRFCSPNVSTCVIPPVSGTFQASPQLVGYNQTSEITWSMPDAVACTVTGSNGDTWTGTASTRITSPITQQTTYTITCDGADDDTLQNDFTDSLTIVRVPSWVER